MLAIRRTFDVVTPESAEHGDVERSGWFDPIGPYEYDEPPEPEQVTFRELVNILAGLEPSCYPLGDGDLSSVWFTEYDENEGTRDYYEKGEARSVSVHFAGDDIGRKHWNRAVRMSR